MQFTMSTLDVLYISLSAGFVVLVGYLVFLIKRVSRTLDRLDPVIDNLHDTTGDIRHLKDSAKSTFFTAASTLLGLFVGRKK